MEIVKRQAKLITKKVESNGDIIIVPDETVTYNFKILLTKKEKDWGFFDSSDDYGEK